MTYSKNNWNNHPVAKSDKRTQYSFERMEDGIADSHANLQLATCVNGEFRWGASTAGYFALSSDGVVSLSGNAKVYEDLRFDSNSAKAAGIKDPAYSTVLGGMRTYIFSATTLEELYINCQMPHAWDGGTIYPHVHWFSSTETTNIACRWGIEYAWADIGSTFSAPTTVYGSTVVPATTVIEKNRHYITELPSITPTTNQDGYSAMLMVRLFRDATVAADTFDQGANLLEFDIHYGIRRLGTTNVS